MTERTLTPMMFDFLWEELQLGEYPYPLTVPSHGETMDERASLRHQVDGQLRASGLKNPYGELEPVLHGSLLLLAFNTTSIDAVHLLEAGSAPVSVLAAADGTHGVLAAHDERGIRLRRIEPDGLVGEVLGLLPNAPRGTARSITLSLDEALRTQPARVTVPSRTQAESQQPSAKKSRFGLSKQLLGLGTSTEPEPERTRKPLSERTAGSAKEDYALLAAEPRDRGGQIAANARGESGTKHRAPVLAWFDTVSGRYLSMSRPGADGQDWVSIAGADAATLRRRVVELLSDVRAQAR